VKIEAWTADSGLPWGMILARLPGVKRSLKRGRMKKPQVLLGEGFLGTGQAALGLPSAEESPPSLPAGAGGGRCVGALPDPAARGQQQAVGGCGPSGLPAAPRVPLAPVLMVCCM